MPRNRYLNAKGLKQKHEKTCAWRHDIEVWKISNRGPFNLISRNLNVGSFSFNLKKFQRVDFSHFISRIFKRESLLTFFENFQREDLSCSISRNFNKGPFSLLIFEILKRKFWSMKKWSFKQEHENMRIKIGA